MSIGPIRNGQFVAKPWRIWSRGDEFYAWQRDAAKFIKVSFHRTKWFLDHQNGQRIDLGRALPLSIPGWSLALQLRFVVPNSPMVSEVAIPVKSSSGLIGVDTPPAIALLVNLLCAPSATTPTSIVPSEVDGARFMAMRLREKGCVMVTAFARPFDATDYAVLLDAQKTRIDAVSPDPATSNVHGELHLIDCGAGGNCITIAPLTAGSFHLTKQNQASQVHVAPKQRP